MLKRASKVLIGLEKLRVEMDIELEQEGLERLMGLIYGIEITPRTEVMLETLEERLEEVDGMGRLDIGKLVLYNIQDIAMNELKRYKVTDNLEVISIDETEIVYGISEILYSDDWLVFYDSRETEKDKSYAPERLQWLPVGYELVEYKKLSKEYLETEDLYEYLEGYMLGPLTYREPDGNTIIVKRK